MVPSGTPTLPIILESGMSVPLEVSWKQVAQTLLAANSAPVESALHKFHLASRAFLPGKSRNSLQETTKTLLQALGVKAASLTMYCPRRGLDCDLLVHLSSHLGKKSSKQQLQDHFRNYDSNLPTCTYQVWTDGSFNPSQSSAGAAAMLLTPTGVFTSQSSCVPSSSTWSEYLGVWLGLDMLSAHPPNTTRFYVDSLSVLQGFSGANSSLPLYLIEAVQVLVNLGFSIEMVHVPAHAGIYLNETVDTLAVQACALPLPALPHPGALRPALEFVLDAARYARAQFIAQFSSEDACQTTQSYLGAIANSSPIPWKALQQHPRWLQRLLVRPNASWCFYILPRLSGHKIWRLDEHRVLFL